MSDREETKDDPDYDDDSVQDVVEVKEDEPDDEPIAIKHEMLEFFIALDYIQWIQIH